MQRFTKRYADGYVYNTGYTMQDVLRKLAEYEDAEEQGLLLMLPCKLNESVYVARKGYKTMKLTYFCASAMLEDLENGYCFGYTKEEAEAALAKMDKE